MKKNLKKLFAIIMTVAVVLSMAMPTMAEEGGAFNVTTGNYTLTINSATSYDNPVTYNVYQLFVANIETNNSTVYSTEKAKNSALLQGKTVADIVDMDADDLWGLAKLMTTKEEIAYATGETGKPIKIEQAGYYLVVPTGRADGEGSLAGGTVSAPIFVPVPDIKKAEGSTAMNKKDDVTVLAKDSDVTTDKTITSVQGVDTTVSSTGNTATLGSGETIKYTISNTVPSYESDIVDSKVNYYVVDTYDSNLELVEGSIKVTSPEGFDEGTLVESPETSMNGTSYTAYTVSGGQYAIKKDSNTFTVYFNYSDVKSLASAKSEVVIEAEFTLKNTATPGKAIPNDSKLYYTNNYYTGTDTYLEDKVDSWTFDFDIYKYDGDSKDALNGAVFGLYKTNADGVLSDEIKQGTSVAGLVDFEVDLNAGTYYVKEITAPAGYRLDETIYEVVIEPATDGTEYTGGVTITVNDAEIGKSITGIDGKTFTNPTLGVENTLGQTLPGTGGIGTTIFTFGGLALIVLAGILLVVYTRKQKKA